jgi:hypothetical protein
MFPMRKRHSRLQSWRAFGDGKWGTIEEVIGGVGRLQEGLYFGTEGGVIGAAINKKLSALGRRPLLGGAEEVGDLFKAAALSSRSEGMAGFVGQVELSSTAWEL